MSNQKEQKQVEQKINTANSCNCGCVCTCDCHRLENKTQN